MPLTPDRPCLALITLACAATAAALHVEAAHATRRDAVRLAAAAAAAVPGLAVAAGEAAPAYVPVKLSKEQVNNKLSKVPVVALVNEDDSPFLTNGQVGYFYLDPIEALRDKKLLEKSQPSARLKVVTLPEVYFPLVRGDQANLGGVLRVRPSRRQVVLANRALAYQRNDNQLLPKTLDEAKGQVPVFYSERVAYEGKDGAQSFPFFLSKDDLDGAYNELQAVTGGPKSEDGTMPIGLVRVATLDGLVDQMLSGEVDLTNAVLVGARSALNGVRSIVQDGAP